MDPNSISEQIVINLPENTWLIPLIAAFIGGLVAGCLTLFGVIINHKLDLKRKEEDEEHELQNFYKAIFSEIEIFWENYLLYGGGNFLRSIKEEGEFFARNVPINQEQFKIYKSHSALIGRIQDEELRKHLIRTYAHAEAMIFSYKENNEINTKFDNMAILVEQTGNEFFKSESKRYYNDLVLFTKGLKAQDDMVYRCNS